MSQIDELRHILVGDNTEQLAELKDRIEDLDQRTSDVAEVLAPAIEAGVKESDRLIESLTEPVSLGLKQAIRTEPDEYAEILYPVMAPAIRRSISQAISSLMVTINQTMASATTAEGLGLRYRAWRTGIPYAQLALRASLLYRVEHLYLIERDSGMLLAELSAPDSGALDSDAVSAMFSAIQSFVQDSFSGRDEDRLTDLQVGEYNVWVAHGRKLMLACVIDGVAPQSLKNELYDVLDKIRGEYASAIATFDGDADGFAGVQDRLQPLMQSQLKEDVVDDADQIEEVLADPSGSLLSRLILLAIIAAAAWFLYNWITEASQQRTVEYYLKQTPGVAVTATYWEDDAIVVEGLQDPDAEIPFSLLAAHNISAEQLSFRTIPFRSLQTDMELLRFNKELQPPADLRFDVEDGKIHLAGEASIGWLLRNDARLRQLAADKRLNLQGLRASESSVKGYLSARFAGADPRLQSRLLDLFVGKPWVDVSVGSLTKPF